MIRDLILPVKNGFYVTFYVDDKIETTFVEVDKGKHIEITLDKGLFIVKDSEDTKFVCHIKDLISWRY